MSVCAFNPCQKCPNVDERRGLRPEIDGTKYGASAGDVLIAFTSISHPILDFIKKNHKKSRKDAGDRISTLEEQSVISQDSRVVDESQKSKGVVPRSKVEEDVEGGMKDRPVILVTGHPTAVRRICVMATFEGRDITTLPCLLQRFLVPVYTTTFPGVMTHIHTAPTWRGKGTPQWIIAYPFDAGSNLHLNRRWDDDDGTGSANYTVGKEFLVYLAAFAVKVANSFRKELAGKQTQEVQEFTVALHCQSHSENSCSCSF